MPSRSPYVTCLFDGGWATDFGETYYGAPDAGGTIHVPFLPEVKNVYFELDGGPHKAGGTTKLNSTTLGATVGVTGLYDYFRMGTTGTSTQKRIIYTNEGAIYKDDNDGTWDSLATGLATTAIPTFATFDDILIIANDSTLDVPRSWDQTTFQNLAGSPPNFSFCVKHKNRVFAAGVAANPSTVSYCVNSDPENWTAAGSGSFDVDPNDGDRIVGLVAHKGDLWIFKGPHYGSIYRMKGSAPTGSDAFALEPFVRGVTAAYHNTIFRYGNDIGFMSSWGTVHSLAATERYGDYTASFLSFPINTYVRTLLNHSRLKQTWAVDDPTHGYVLFTVPLSGQTTNTAVICMDYRANPLQPRWSLWDGFDWASIALITDTNDRKRIFAGGYTGYVWRADQDNRTNDGAAINFSVSLPFLTLGTELRIKTLDAIGVGLVPKNNNAVNLTWTRDQNTPQSSTTMTQGAGGGVFDTAVFNTGTFGGGRASPRFLETEEGGEFRAVQINVQDTTNSSDLEVHSIGLKTGFGTDSMENT